jgi:hypothetical protein
MNKLISFARDVRSKLSIIRKINLGDEIDCWFCLFYFINNIKLLMKLLDLERDLTTRLSCTFCKILEYSERERSII